MARPQHVSTRQLGLFEEVAPLRDPERIEQLPATARQLVEIIGLDATIELVKAEGGNELRIPDVVGGASRMWARLQEIIGDEAATSLVERCRHTGVYVPMCVAALRAERNRDILARFDRGEDFDSIRRRYKVSRSYLFRLLKKSP